MIGRYEPLHTISFGPARKHIIKYIEWGVRMKIQPITLTGNHVHIVPMAAEHVEELFAAGNHDQIWDYMPMEVEQPADMERLVQEALTSRETGESFPFVIQSTTSGRLVGSTRFLDISLVNRNLEIGWTWLSPEVWRTPINTECKYLLLKHCFETLAMLRVQIKTDGRNIRSQKAIERIGGIREGVLRRNRIMYDGYVRDTVYFSILAEEWSDVKSKLELVMKI